jgi:DNA-binding transcriptional regulator YiaG
MVPEQCRAARGWLNLSQGELAEAAHLSLSTVKDFESGRRKPIDNNLAAIVAALQSYGIRFTDNGLTGPPMKLGGPV